MEGGVLVVNPGEAGGWLHGRSTAALLDNTVISKTGSLLRYMDVEIITI
jgi:predicted phosphodiesterase